MESGVCEQDMRIEDADGFVPLYTARVGQRG